jgi:hypothetical protein
LESAPLSNPLISLRIDDALLADLDHEAVIAGIERAEFARRAIASAVHVAATARLSRRVPEPSGIGPNRWPPQPQRSSRYSS